MQRDERVFRDALGAFATGVTVVTTMDQHGKPVGMTANSFTSLSLDPPLIIWNPAKRAQCYDAFIQAEHYCVHILHAGQQNLSSHFATKTEDKFSDIEWQKNKKGSPVLSDYATCFHCSSETSYPGGDHTILVGRVYDLDDNAHLDPLIFYRSAYKILG